MANIFVIAEPCVSVKDKACVPACPVDCIWEYDETQKKLKVGNVLRDPGATLAEDQLKSQLFIDPEACIGCAACVAPCPVSAIFEDDDLPAKWKHFQELNKNAFI